MQEPWEEETFLTEDGNEYNDWDESTWQQHSAEEYDYWEEDADLETFLAGESDWIHRDVLIRACTKPTWSTRRLATR